MYSILTIINACIVADEAAISDHNTITFIIIIPLLLMVAQENKQAFAYYHLILPHIISNFQK